MKFKAIIFDFDGVVFDSEHLHQLAQVRVLENAGVAGLTESSLDDYTGVADKEIFRRVLTKHDHPFDDALINEISHHKVKAYQDIIAETDSLHDEMGIKNFLDFVIQHFSQLAICSNSSSGEVAAVLDRLEEGALKQHFKTIVTIDRVKVGKPEPDCYLLAASELGVDPKDCLVIEDSATGATAAKSAGMTVVGLSASKDSDTLHMADFVAENYDVIEKWLMA